MPKKRLIQIATEQEVEFDEAMRIAEEKLPEGSTLPRSSPRRVPES